MILISVDLPAPFSPTRPCTSPENRSRLTPRSATTPGKNLLTLRRRTGTGAVPGSVIGAGRRLALSSSPVRRELVDVILCDDERAHRVGDARQVLLVDV